MTDIEMNFSANGNSTQNNKIEVNTSSKQIIVTFSDGYCIVLENNEVSIRENDFTKYRIVVGDRTNELLEFVKDTYLQLKRKEQECEELKKQYNCYACDTCKGKEDYINLKRHCENAIKALHNKQAEFDQLKATNENLKKAKIHIENNRKQKANKLMRIEKLITACSTGYTDEFIQELLVILHEPEPASFENKYLQTLTEIKEIAEKSCCTQATTTCEEYKNCTECGRIGDADTIQQILQKISEVENELN